MSHGGWKSVATPLGYLANSRRRQRRVAQALAYSTSASSSDDSVPQEHASQAVPVSAPSAVAPSRFSFRPLETLASYRAAAEAASSLPTSHPPYLPVPAPDAALAAPASDQKDR